MQELTFETILRLPQMELKKMLKAELKSRGYPVTDKPGYLYAEGAIPVLLVAHMDTVHRQPVDSDKTQHHCCHGGQALRCSLPVAVKSRL